MIAKNTRDFWALETLYFLTRLWFHGFSLYNYSLNWILIFNALLCMYVVFHTHLHTRTQTIKYEKIEI